MSCLIILYGFFDENLYISSEYKKKTKQYYNNDIVIPVYSFIYDSNIYGEKKPNQTGYIIDKAFKIAWMWTLAYIDTTEHRT